MKRFESKHLIFLPYFLIFGVAMLRIEMINPFNVVPIFSCLLVFAAMRPAREFALPLSALVGVDIFVTIHRYSHPVTADAAITWAWYLIAMLLGASLLRTSRSWQRVAGCSLLTSVSFFLASNFAVWTAWQLYPKSLIGLEACYEAALPFFRNSLTSELCFSLLLFGLMNRIGSRAAVAIASEAHC